MSHPRSEGPAREMHFETTPAGDVSSRKPKPEVVIDLRVRIYDAKKLVTCPVVCYLRGWNILALSILGVIHK